MKSKFLFVIGALLILLAALPFFKTTAGSIEWQTDAKAAFARAESSEEPVLTFLYTDWCTYCRQMDETTFKDEEVISELGDEFVWLRLNPEKSEQGALLRQRFGISGFPTILLFDHEGQELDRIQGFVPAELFVETVNSALQNPSSLAALRRQLKENPDGPEIHYRIAEKLMEQRKFSEAGRFFQKAIELDSRNETGKLPSSLYYLAETQMYARQDQAALETLGSLRRDFPDNEFSTEADLLEAEIFLDQGKRGQAKMLLTRFLEENPVHPAVERIRQFLSE